MWLTSRPARSTKKSIPAPCPSRWTCTSSPVSVSMKISPMRRKPKTQKLYGSPNSAHSTHSKRRRQCRLAARPRDSAAKCARRHRSDRAISSGILSNQRTGLPQSRQCDAGRTTDSSYGMRVMHTLRKLPIASPTTKSTPSTNRSNGLAITFRNSVTGRVPHTCPELVEGLPRDLGVPESRMRDQNHDRPTRWLRYARLRRACRCRLEIRERVRVTTTQTRVPPAGRRQDSPACSRSGVLGRRLFELRVPSGTAQLRTEFRIYLSEPTSLDFSFHCLYSVPSKWWSPSQKSEIIYHFDGTEYKQWKEKSSDVGWERVDPKFGSELCRP